MATAEYSRQYRARNVAAGRCVQCTSPAAAGMTLCDRHLEYQRAANAKHAGKGRRNAGFRTRTCDSCGAELPAINEPCAFC